MPRVSDMDFTHRRWSMRSLPQAAVGCLLAAGLLLAPGGASPAAALVVPSPGPGSAGVADPNGVTLSLKRAAGGFDQPVLVQTAADGVARLFVVERSGRIMIYSGGSVRSKPYLNIRGRVNAASGEQGLLGLAFSPNFAPTATCGCPTRMPSGALQVSRFTAKSPTSRHVYGRRPRSRSCASLTRATPTTTAGCWCSARTTGCTSRPETTVAVEIPSANARTGHTLAGKILRINPFSSCADKHYCVPKSNPYAKPGGASAPSGCTASAIRGGSRPTARRGICGSATSGQAATRRSPASPTASRAGTSGGPAGRPDGLRRESRCSSAQTYHDPTIAYGQREGDSVIGGYVYRGCSGCRAPGRAVRLRRLRQRPLWVQRAWHQRAGREAGAYRLTSFGQDGSGELWATTLDGGLYRVVASGLTRAVSRGVRSRPRATIGRTADRAPAPTSQERPCPTSR